MAARALRDPRLTGRPATRSPDHPRRPDARAGRRGARGRAGRNPVDAGRQLRHHCCGLALVLE